MSASDLFSPHDIAKAAIDVRPDIGGKVQWTAGGFDSPAYEGAMFVKLVGTSRPAIQPGAGDVQIDLKASRSSSLYSKSQTIQPSALRLLAIIKW